MPVYVVRIDSAESPQMRKSLIEFETHVCVRMVTVMEEEINLLKFSEELREQVGSTPR